jgi:DNA-binding transcriptional MerR regulator
MEENLGIDELADATGLSRRAIRFYVQQKLLPAPLGVGRGKHYDRSHLDRLKRLLELQTAGYSLDSIRQILNGGQVDAPRQKIRRRAPRPSLQLWTRVPVADGVELYVNVERYGSDVRQLLQARKVLRTALGLMPSIPKGEQNSAAKRKGRKNGSQY